MRISDWSSDVSLPIFLRFRSGGLAALIGAINATGYGLTFGLHTLLDDTITLATQMIEAGNIYVYRNMVGAVVGDQPFGGRGLSGTGPKAGGPLYLTHQGATAQTERSEEQTSTLEALMLTTL